MQVLAAGENTLPLRLLFKADAHRRPHKFLMKIPFGLTTMSTHSFVVNSASLSLESLRKLQQ